MAAMRRTTLILVIVLVVVLLGGGAWYWMNRDKFTPATTTNTSVTNTATTTTNTNRAANLNLSVPTEIKGDKELNGKATVANVELTFSSVSRVATFEGEQAPAKQFFVVVYLDPVDGTKVLAVKSGLTTDSHLVTNKGSFTPVVLKIASTIYKGDRGFLKFAVPEEATSFSLEIGPTASPQRIPLPL